MHELWAACFTLFLVLVVFFLTLSFICRFSFFFSRGGGGGEHVGCRGFLTFQVLLLFVCKVSQFLDICMLDAVAPTQFCMQDIQINMQLEYRGRVFSVQHLLCRVMLAYRVWKKEVVPSTLRFKCTLQKDGLQIMKLCLEIFQTLTLHQRCRGEEREKAPSIFIIYKIYRLTCYDFYISLCYVFQRLDLLVCYL